MTSESNEPSIQKKKLRLWPGVVVVALQWVVRFVVPVFAPEAQALSAMGGLVGGLLVLVWWAFFSRAPHSERWGAIVLMIVAMAASSQILHVSIATGMMGFMFYLYAIPGLSLAFVVWAVASRRLGDGPRRATMVATIVLSCAVWALFQTAGFTGDGNSDFSWRWAQTAEERFLAEAGEVSTTVPALVTVVEPGDDWPGFRGPGRDGIVSGVRLETDWAASPPKELWRRSVGPAWSSFAVRGDLFYTQEQRGDDEIVACYNGTTGEPVWQHRDAARFWESNAGAGPRGTPTLADGRVYSFGGTGILNALDADTGVVIWSRNAATDTGAELPDWGFSSSPRAVEDLVVVATSGSLVAYDRDVGDVRWIGLTGGVSYSSPHLATIDGVQQFLQLNGDGATGIAPDDGTLLWQHPWSGYPIVQPALTAEGDVLISVSGESGTRRLAVEKGSGGWTVEERWTSRGLKPYFNDFVVHEGHAYGFDGRILACIDLEDGSRKWKGGRYGNGQLLLLSDQDVLLVLSELGELVLVAAVPDGFTELARFPAIEGKTWNHPVLVGDRLLVRNGEEMVAFELALEAG